MWNSKKTKSSNHAILWLQKASIWAPFLRLAQKHKEIIIAAHGERAKYTIMESDEAEILALKALTYLAGLDEVMDRFSDLTGMAQGDIVERASDTEMLAGILEFYLSDEALLTEFCEAFEIPLEAPARAHAALPGGDLPHWT